MPSTSTRARFDWRTWSDGSVWVLRPGEDFPADMALDDLHDRAYVYAYRHGLYAHLERHHGGETCSNRSCQERGVAHPDEAGRFVYCWFEPRVKEGVPA